MARLKRPKGFERVLKRAAKKKFKPKTKSARLEKRLKAAEDNRKRRKAGEPRTEYSYQEIEDIVASVLNCPLSELAVQLGISRETADRRMHDDVKFKQAVKRGRRRAKFNLRVAQNTMADAGDSRMGIWLGKNYLKQMEPAQRHEFSGTADLSFGADALANRIADEIERERKVANSSKDEHEGESSD
jgi:hypothetical protein